MRLTGAPRWLATVLLGTAVLGIAGCRPPQAPAGSNGSSEPELLREVRVIGEVDGRTAWSLHATEVLLRRGPRATLAGVVLKLPHGLAAAGAAALMSLALAPAAGAAKPVPAPVPVPVPVPVPAAAPAAVPAPVPAAAALPMEIAADRLEVDRKAGRAVFTGAVVATRGELALRCDRLVATYDPEGALETVVAEGRVSLASGRLEATAARADYRESEATIVLEGSLRVTDGKSTLTGERARILLDEERFVVEKARGRLVFAAPAKGAKAAPASAAARAPGGP